MAASEKSFRTIMVVLWAGTRVRCFFPYLQRLPTELCLEVFGMLLNSPGGNILFYSEALHVLQKLQMSPEDRYSVPCSGPLFVRWITVGKTSYLAGLYDKKVSGSSLIKAADKDWDHVVLRWNDFGVTYATCVDSRSAPHIAAGSGYLQVLRRCGRIWISMEGLLVSHIDQS
ncbi:hypothetical protein CC86DRAFT_113088 [Ophiobolus disseminans]|uniref:Uncharacterized protein n=1 Tax=Ophiobolus disseminans TaxID=1469910 RepID=A0A6A6ZIQ5_9PLEO|nr:hypothetical protein CC86DRAFT_113088 [Ophiobolus disseminans]